MNRDSGKPGGEGGSTFELPEVLIGAHIGVLHNVFGLVTITENRYHHAVKALVVPAHDDFLERGFAGQHTLHNSLVRPSFDARLIENLHGALKNSVHRAKKVTGFELLCFGGGSQAAVTFRPPRPLLSIAGKFAAPRIFPSAGNSLPCAVSG
jgi:hypothetical protein